MASGATIFGCAGLELGAAEAAFFREADPWGFILFARNIDTPEQVAQLTSSLREAVGRDAPVLIDQEGGRVQRLRAPHWREWLPPLDQALAARDPARSFWLRARLQAAELRALGIDVNCAPTCDIAGPETHPFLRNRCFGTTPEAVISGARATAEGLLAGGVLPVIKHIPGHGRATADSHKDLPVVTAPRAELEALDFAPFRALAGLPLAMTAHIRFTALDDAPATQSPALIRLIREEIGFGGLLMTDDISMEALSGSVASRARASLAAGCDVILHCNGERPEMEAIAAEAGRLAPAAAARAAAALGARKSPGSIDMAALEAELEACL
ncbi:beta-N-acetylhexosaminidase [Thioclava arenosa]|uniref:beta-N-acetylhexosaminidase n=1 Tax=Pseudothioclava arenosa TaxID=1795308 RepID=A0A2A4CTE9_9RHOB|nr:beta-N-acetylhexosaminidase [Pseudothioclava arenosa]